MAEKEQKPIRTAVTKESLMAALQSVGVGPNMILEVHSSLSSLGYVVGGARTVVDALMELSEPGGTILMATQTAENSDPSSWCNPPAAPETWKMIRENMPAYDPETSDLSEMGAVAENFRHRAGVVSSCHPSDSYAAWGRYAKLLCNRQSMHFPLAEESPAARIYELKGYVLLIGVDFTKATCMHLAEYRSECRPIVINCACVQAGGKRGWKKYLNLDIDSSDFEKVRSSLEKKSMIRETMLGNCHIQLFPVNAAVDEAVRYFEKNVVYDLYR